MDTRIYVMTHKAYTNPDDTEYDGLYRPMHVGRAISGDLGYPGDDTGDNISGRNKSWCELTGIYWVWKNVSCDIVGICHYRRYFVCDEDFLRKDRIEELMSQYQVIAGNSSATEYGSLKEHYAAVHHAEDLETCRQVLSEKHPEYLPAFDLCMDSNLFSIGNMMITTKDIHDSYCEWLFDILFEAEKRIDITGYDAFQARVMGYLSERLMRVWLLYNRYRVCELEVRMIDPADRDNQIKAVELKRQYVSLTLQDLTAGYRAGNYMDLVDTPALYTDFHGRIPVWVCWWQGEDDMPEIVRMCIDSIRRSIPVDKCELHLITLDSVGEYVTFPSWIVEKYRSGLISMTFLSDILRMGLLYRYGGMWIDATYYVADTIPEEIFDRRFWTQRASTPRWRADVVQGRWSCNLLYGQAGDLLFRYVLNAFYLYWFKEDKVVDYYLFDYLIDAAYSNLPAVREQIDACPYSEPELMEMQAILDEPYDPDRFGKLTEDTVFFKLTHRLSPKKENIVGKETFYGHLLRDKKI